MMGQDEDPFKEKIRAMEEDNLVLTKRIDTKEFMSKREAAVNKQKEETYI